MHKPLYSLRNLLMVSNAQRYTISTNRRCPPLRHPSHRIIFFTDCKSHPTRMIFLGSITISTT